MSKYAPIQFRGASLEVLIDQDHLLVLGEDPRCQETRKTQQLTLFMCERLALEQFQFNFNTLLGNINFNTSFGHINFNTVHCLVTVLNIWFVSVGAVFGSIRFNANRSYH